MEAAHLLHGSSDCASGALHRTEPAVPHGGTPTTRPKPPTRRPGLLECRKLTGTTPPQGRLHPHRASRRLLPHVRCCVHGAARRDRRSRCRPSSRTRHPIRSQPGPGPRRMRPRTAPPAQGCRRTGGPSLLRVARCCDADVEVPLHRSWCSRSSGANGSSGNPRT